MIENHHAAEAKERWGDTDAYRESQRRSSGYSKEDIAKATHAMQSATDLMAKAMTDGLSAQSLVAMDGAEAHRLSISDWWYECNYEMHKNLAQMYLLDPRFKAHYESQAVGLAQFVSDAIFANAARNS